MYLSVEMETAYLLRLVMMAIRYLETDAHQLARLKLDGIALDNRVCVLHCVVMVTLQEQSNAMMTTQFQVMVALQLAK